MVTGTHNERVLEQFALQASTFTGGGFAVRGLDWIVESLRPRRDEVVLDVACGAAHLARALAPHVAHVTGIDLTVQMLRQGDTLTRDARLTNVTLQVGDATEMPWIDGQFDLTVCRLALHQVHDPAAVVGEMVRVTRPGGRIAVIDLVADNDPRIAAEMNRLERLRDPSHGTALTVDHISDLLQASGALLAGTLLRPQALDLEDWMQRTQTPEAERNHIRSRLAEELDGGQKSGLRPGRDKANGRIAIHHEWAIVHAGRGASPSPR